MEKKIFTAVVLTVAIAAFLSVYWLLEPHRVKVVDASQPIAVVQADIIKILSARGLC